MAHIDIKKVSLEEALKSAEKRLGYKLSSLALMGIASYFLKLYLLSGGYVPPLEEGV